MNTIQTITSHQSLRNFTGAKITDEQLKLIEDAIIQTSSSCFLQLVTTIVIRDKEKLAKIAKYSGDQEHIAQCDTFLFFCLDMTKLEHVLDIKPPYGIRFIVSGLNDCSLACQNAYLAAESLGLGGVIIGGYRNSIKECSELMHLPKGVVPLLGLCLGVPDPEFKEQQKPRLPRSWLIMNEEFKDPYDQQELAQYDQQMLDYYKNRRTNQKGATWSQASAKMVKFGYIENDASHIIAFLKEQGFDFF